MNIFTHTQSFEHLDEGDRNMQVSSIAKPVTIKKGNLEKMKKKKTYIPNRNFMTNTELSFNMKYSHHLWEKRRRFSPTFKKYL